MKVLDWILFIVLFVLVFQWCTQENVMEKGFEKDIVETSIDFISEYVEYADSVSNIKQQLWK